MPMPSCGKPKGIRVTRIAKVHPDRLLDGRLKFRHLLLFVAIADHGSLIKASEQLHITQPALSRALKELEVMLDVRLFDRVPTGVVPTEAGRIFLKHARTILGDVRNAAVELENFTGARMGTVRVGTHMAGANMLLPRAVGQLKQERPNLTIVVREGTPDVLESSLYGGDLDLVVGRLTSVTQQGLSQVPLYREPIVLAVRRGHPALDLASPDLADLVRFSWILPLEQTSLRSELEQVFTSQDLPQPTNRIECTSMMTLRALLQEGDLIAALPMLVVQEDVNLAILPIDLPSLRRPVGVTLLADRERSVAVEALLTHLDSVARDLKDRVSRWVLDEALAAVPTTPAERPEPNGAPDAGDR